MFLENDFPSKGKIRKGKPLYELDGRVVLDGSTIGRKLVAHVT